MSVAIDAQMHVGIDDGCVARHHQRAARPLLDVREGIHIGPGTCQHSGILAEHPGHQRSMASMAARIAAGMGVGGPPS